MNSALQSLSNCAPLTGYFLECSDYIQMRILYKSNYFDSFSASNNSKQGNSLPCLSLSYMKLMRELWEDHKKSSKNNRQSSRRTSYSPHEFVQVIKYLNPMFRGYMQHDSQEFLIYLMDQLHEELKRPVYTEIDENEDMYAEIDDEKNDQSDESSNENERLKKSIYNFVCYLNYTVKNIKSHK